MCVCGVLPAHAAYCGRLNPPSASLALVAGVGGGVCLPRVNSPSGARCSEKFVRMVPVPYAEDLAL